MANSRKPAPENKPAPAAAPDGPVLAALHDTLAAWLARRPDGSVPTGAAANPGAVSPDLRHDVLPLLAVAFSGGLDSSVLLDAVVRVAPALGVRVAAFHVHHGLSPEADAWQDFCAARAAVLGVAFDARRVVVPRNAGTGLEAAARAARYEALHGMCHEHGAVCLLLAHHADDQTETVLLQLLRGSGLPGVSGMATETLQTPSSAALLRPWLGVPRAALEAYARARGLAWVDDVSNRDEHYLRNALRHHVLPAIGRHVPGYREMLGRFARHARQAQGLLDELAAQDWRAAANADALNRQILCQLSDARIGNALRYWLHRRSMRAISEARLADWVRQIRAAGPDTRMALTHEGGTLRLYRGLLHWEAASATGALPEGPIESLRWSGQMRWPLPRWRGCLVLTPIGGQAAEGAVPESCLRAGELTAAPRAGGERLRLHARESRKTLKNLFQAAGVPAWQRNVPVIRLDGRMLYVPRLGGDSEWSAVPAEAYWRLDWQDNDAGEAA